MRGRSSGLTVSGTGSRRAGSCRGAKPVAGGVWAAAGIVPTRPAASGPVTARRREISTAVDAVSLGSSLKVPPPILVKSPTEQDSGEP